MPTPAMTAEKMQEALKLVREHGSINAAAVASGLARTTLQDRFNRAVANGLDEAIVGQVPAGHTVKGVSTLYNAEGKVLQQWVKDKTTELSFEEQVAAIQGAFEDWRGQWLNGGSVDWAAKGNTNSNLLTVYPLPDWHIGLLSWRHETDVDWDLTIAKKVLSLTTDRLIGLTPPSGTAVLLGLGDLLHSDGYENLTPQSKHILDVDGRWPKVLRTAVWLLIDTIEKALLKHEKVIVRILPGNHDQESAISVALALSMRYDGHPRVEVDDSANRFWWYEFGNNLLGATHGDKAKMRDLPLLMATRNKEAWGRTKYRHIMTGHIHTQTGIEQAGVTVESFRTPVAPDSYHANMGYNAGRTMTAITFDKEYGELARARTPIIGEGNEQDRLSSRPDNRDAEGRS